MEKELLQQSIDRKTNQIYLLQIILKSIRYIQEKKDKNNDAISLNDLDVAFNNQ